MERQHVPFRWAFMLSFLLNTTHCLLLCLFTLIPPAYSLLLSLGSQHKTSMTRYEELLGTTLPLKVKKNYEHSACLTVRSCGSQDIHTLKLLSNNFDLNVNMVQSTWIYSSTLISNLVKLVPFDPADRQITALFPTLTILLCFLK